MTTDKFRIRKDKWPTRIGLRLTKEELDFLLEVVDDLLIQDGYLETDTERRRMVGVQRILKEASTRLDSHISAKPGKW